MDNALFCGYKWFNSQLPWKTGLEVELNTVEDNDGEWSWGAADLSMMPTNSSIHMFNCGEDGVMGDDGLVDTGSNGLFSSV